MQGTDLAFIHFAIRLTGVDLTTRYSNLLSTCKYGSIARFARYCCEVSSKCQDIFPYNQGICFAKLLIQTNIIIVFYFFSLTKFKFYAIK